MSRVSEAAKLLGRKGGRARAARLSSEDKRRIASLGGKARAESLRAEQRILRNLRYAALLGELRGRRRPKRLSSFEGPLPGIDAQLKKIARAKRSFPGDAEDIAFLESLRKARRER